MIWDVRALNALTKIVDRKFDEDFLYDLAGWKQYLAEHDIIRKPFQFRKKRSSGDPHVWIECPWSVRNSAPGAVYTKSELFFPMDLAEKIVILEGMP